MRLRPSDREGIVQAIESVCKKENVLIHGIALYLFGSRVRDDLKGGDIDLLIRVPTEKLKEVKSLEVEFSVSIQERIGEQKVDILIVNVSPPHDPFHQIAVENAILLKQW